MLITSELEASGDAIHVKLKSEEEPNFERWVSVYYLSFFLKTRFAPDFYSSREENSLVAKTGDTVVGIIMGVYHD